MRNTFDTSISFLGEPLYLRLDYDVSFLDGYGNPIPPRARLFPEQVDIISVELMRSTDETAYCHDGEPWHYSQIIGLLSPAQVTQLVDKIIDHEAYFAAYPETALGPYSACSQEGF